MAYKELSAEAFSTGGENPSVIDGFLEAFSTEFDELTAEFDEFEYALSISQVRVDEYYMGYTSHIDYDVTSDGKTATVVLANTGDRNAMADCTVLFFKGDTLVDIGQVGADLQPGDEATQFVSAFHDKSFDTVQAYVSAITLD